MQIDSCLASVTKKVCPPTCNECHVLYTAVCGPGVLVSYSLIFQLQGHKGNEDSFAFWADKLSILCRTHSSLCTVSLALYGSVGTASEFQLCTNYLMHSLYQNCAYWELSSEDRQHTYRNAHTYSCISSIDYNSFELILLTEPTRCFMKLKVKKLGKWSHIIFNTR